MAVLLYVHILNTLFLMHENEGLWILLQIVVELTKLES